MIAIEDARANGINVIIYDRETGTMLNPECVAIRIDGIDAETLEDLSISYADANAFVDENPDRVMTLWIEE